MNIDESVIYNSEEELLKKAYLAKGKKVRELINRDSVSGNKGKIGQLIEEDFFGLKNNSRAEADFINFNIELKVTPIKLNKNQKYAAKERLVLNIINYLEEELDNFEESSFWKKNSKLLILFYIYEEDKNFLDFVIDDVVLYKYPENDLAIIKNDWEIITSYIKEGKADQLSERLTNFLSACTKGANKNSLRDQPYSDVKAKQRAYSFKNSYMTVVFNDYVKQDINTERIIKDTSVLNDRTMEEYVIDELNNYKGVELDSLYAQFDINPKAKSSNASLIARLLNCEGTTDELEEFRKANIKIKTIPLVKSKTGNLRVKESMSFKKFDFKELAVTEWEDSYEYKHLSRHKFLLCVFLYDENTQLKTFHKAMFWTIPDNDLEEVRKVYERTRGLLNDGLTIEFDGKYVRTNLPKSVENRVSHVRTHARDRDDTLQLPDGRYLTKQCFWLNSTYIYQILGLEKNE